MFIYQDIYREIDLPTYLSIYLSIYLYICMSISIYLYRLNHQPVAGVGRPVRRLCRPSTLRLPRRYICIYIYIYMYIHLCMYAFRPPLLGVGGPLRWLCPPSTRRLPRRRIPTDRTPHLGRVCRASCSTIRTRAQV